MEWDPCYMAFKYHIRHMDAERSRSAHVTVAPGDATKLGILGCKTRGLRRVPLRVQGAKAALEGWNGILVTWRSNIIYGTWTLSEVEVRM